PELWLKSKKPKRNDSVWAFNIVQGNKLPDFICLFRRVINFKGISFPKLLLYICNNTHLCFLIYFQRPSNHVSFSWVSILFFHFYKLKNIFFGFKSII